MKSVTAKILQLYLNIAVFVYSQITSIVFLWVFWCCHVLAIAFALFLQAAIPESDGQLTERSRL
jgi:hypothetical protein